MLFNGTRKPKTETRNPKTENRKPKPDDDACMVIRKQWGGGVVGWTWWGERVGGWERGEREGGREGSRAPNAPALPGLGHADGGLQADLARSCGAEQVVPRGRLADPARGRRPALLDE